MAMPRENTRTRDKQCTAKTGLMSGGSAGSDVGCTEIVKAPVMTGDFYTHRLRPRFRCTAQACRHLSLSD